MEIKSSIKWGGVDYPVKYKDLDTFKGITDFNQIYGVCFVDDKIVICFNKSLGFWVLPGGTPEAGETIEQALAREIMEEAGLRLISYKPLGVQEVFGDGKIRKQLRAVCVCEKVAITGFGTFDLGKRASRRGRNPQTGEIIHIPEMKMPRFRAGKSLKEEVR